MIQNTISVTPIPVQTPAPKKPNDTGSISVEGHVRIFDPKTKEVFVEKRA
jgi:hypothetical protein